MAGGMSLLAATVVATSAMFGGVHFDADAQGRAVLAWDGWRGGRFVTRTVDVRDGRPAGRVHELWREASSAVVELSDMDVSPAGAAVGCLRQRANRFRRGWRV